MALSDYTPVLAWFADSLSDLDKPTGTTPSNPGGLTSPTLAGAPDSYADFDGADNISFLPATPVNEVGTGDITIVMKARLDTLVNGDIVWENYDGSGTSGSAHGLRIKMTSGVNHRLMLMIPPRADSFALESGTFGSAGTDFIIAFRRSSGTWTVWVDADASGGMTTNSPATNSIGSSAITECGDITFGSDRAGANPFDGRVYWMLTFNAAISDTDIQLSTWDDEAALKSAFGFASIGFLPFMQQPAPVVLAH